MARNNALNCPAEDGHGDPPRLQGGESIGEESDLA